MKTFSLVIISFAAVTAYAADLGATRSQIEAAYGKPVELHGDNYLPESVRDAEGKEHKRPAAFYTGYQVGDLGVWVHYNDKGLVNEVSYNYFQNGKFRCFGDEDFKRFLGLNGFTTENRYLSAYKFNSLTDTNFGDTLYPLGYSRDGKYTTDCYLKLEWTGPEGGLPLERAPRPDEVPAEDRANLENRVDWISFVTLEALNDHQKSQNEWQAYDKLARRLISPEELRKIAEQKSKERFDRFSKESR
jgi:hypothetical protein